MQSDNLNGCWLRSNDLFTGQLRLHYGLLDLNFLLEQILYLFYIIDVVLVDEKFATLGLRPLFLLLDLLHEFPLILYSLCLSGLLEFLLGNPMLLVRLQIRLELCMLLTLLNLAFILPLSYLLHEVVFKRCVRLSLGNFSLHVCLKMSLFIDNLLLIDVYIGQPVFFEISRPRNSHCGQSDLFLLFNHFHGLRNFFLDSLIVLSIVIFDALLK